LRTKNRDKRLCLTACGNLQLCHEQTDETKQAT
jgi:hypothetical protein